MVQVTSSSMALDYHFETGMLFWSDLKEHCIYKAPIDEGQAKTVVGTGSVINAEGLAVDWIYHHLYWTDPPQHSIQIADFKGKWQKSLVSDGVQEPRAIAVDPLQGSVATLSLISPFFQSLLQPTSIPILIRNFLFSLSADQPSS